MRRFSSLLFVLLLTSAQGQLTYDADTGTAGAQDGAGAGWNTLNTNFWNGATNVAWPNTTSDVAIFGAGSGAAGTVTVGTVTANGLTFNAPGSGNYTLSGGTITLGGTTPTIAANANATIGSVISGTAGLTKTGAGILTLTGVNNFTGGTTISNGTVGATVNLTQNSLGTGAINVGTGTTLQWNNTSNGNLTVANTMTGSGRIIMNFTAGGAARNTSITGLAGFTGTIELASPAVTGDKWNASVGTLNAALQINAGNQFFLAGNSTFNNGITVSGTGNTENRGAIRATTGTLGGNIFLAGNTTIGPEGGTLSGNISTVVAGTSTLTVGTSNSGSNFTYNGVMSNGTGTLAFVKERTNDLTLGGANTYSGGTTLNAGRLVLNGSGTVGTGTVTVASGAQLLLGWAGTLSNAITISGNGDVGADTQPRGALRIESGGIIGSSGSVTLAANASIGSYNSNTGTVNAPISGGFAMTINASSLNAPGTIIFGGTNSYTGGTTVANGTLRVNAPASLPSTGTHTVNTGATLELTANGTITYAQTLAGTGRILLNSTGGTQNTYLTGANTGFTGTLELTGNSGNKLNTTGLNLSPTATIRVNSGGQLFVQSSIANPVQITGTGNTESRGAIRLSGANTLSGPVSLLGNATIGLEGGTISGAISSGAAGTQTLQLGGTAGQSSGTFSGAIGGGTGTVRVLSAGGTSTLSGNNTYTGGTLVNAGTLILSGNNTTTGSTTVEGGTLRFANAGAMNTAAPNSLIANGGVVQMNGTSLTVGASAIRPNAIIENASAAPATITFGTSGDSLVTGQLRDGAGGGALSLAKSGSGVLTLNNTSQTYTGTTSVLEGTLRLAPPSATNPVASGLSWDLDASTATDVNGGAAINGAAVTDWSAGTGPSVAQGTVANQPTFQTAVQNGLSVVRFDGVNDSLTSTIANAQVQTIFIVNDPGNLKSLAGIVGGNGSAGTLSDRGIRGTGGAWSSPGNGNDFTNPADSQLRINGVLTNTHAAGFQVLTATRQGSAQAFNAVGSYFGGREFTGDIGEILAFNRVLTPAEIVQVESYLNGKWLGMANTTNLLPTNTAVTVASGATLDLVSNITQTIGSLSGPSGASVALGGTSALTTGAANTSTTFSGIISGTGSLAKIGSGVFTLAGANTFTGGTTITGGTLLANNTSGSATGTGAVIVQNGATLGGNGTIVTTGLTVQSGGTLAPGTSPGNLTVTGPVTLAAGSLFGVEVTVGGVTAVGNGTNGTDLLTVNGTIDVTGALLTGTYGGDLDNLFTGNLNADNMTWIVDNDASDSIAGTFANTTPSPGLSSLFGATAHFGSVGGQPFAVFYNSQFGVTNASGLAGGNDLLLIAIPEPGRALLALVAFLPLLLRRRRA